MTTALTPELHPWLSTPDALTAARQSVGIPMTLLGGRARAVGSDELLSEALAVLTECALPPRVHRATSCARCGEPIIGRRAGAKFCSSTCRMTFGTWVYREKANPLPSITGAHVGSMHSWPEDKMMSHATREVGYVLCNYLRTRSYGVEIPATDYLADYAQAEIGS